MASPELAALFAAPPVAPPTPEPPIPAPPIPAPPPAAPEAPPQSANWQSAAPAAQPPSNVPPYANRVESPHKGLIIFLHISQLAGYIVPMLGWILPLVLWLTNRDKPDVDRHGKEVVNFMIIVVPCIILSAVLMFVLIGFLLLPLVLIGQLVCVILAVVKASNDEFFRYPVPFRLIS